jgi:hypothetical protein
MVDFLLQILLEITLITQVNILFTLFNWIYINIYKKNN